MFVEIFQFSLWVRMFPIQYQKMNEIIIERKRKKRTFYAYVLVLQIVLVKRREKQTISQLECEKKKMFVFSRFLKALSGRVLQSN